MKRLWTALLLSLKRFLKIGTTNAKEKSMNNSLFDIIFNDLYDVSSQQTDSVKSVGDVYQAKIVLPGIKKDKVSISATNDFLKVFLKEQENKKLLRKINLGGLVDIKSISSKLEDGILEITLPKSEISESIQVEVS
jgi:HSP20 family molecular chaperone IbpA